MIQMRTRQEQNQLDHWHAKAKDAWIAAAEFDGIDPASPFIIHSRGNPHMRRFDQIISDARNAGIRIRLDVSV